MERRKLSDLIDEDVFFQAEIRIGPFKLLDKIGNGKFATVSLGVHEDTKEKVAIKQIKKSELNTDNLLTKEISIQKILFHPYLTKMYCVIEKEDSIFIVTEYCAKGDLLNFMIENRVFEEEEACKIFQQVLSSLEYLHNNNISHRDIKPENILLNEYGDAKLSDFGLSTKFEKGKLLEKACGSPLYAAPEMLTGKKYDGTKIDIWSLGISLYAMVCGELPFDDEDNNMKNIVYKIKNGKYTLPDNLSPLCKDLIKRILEANPDKRITLEEIKNHQWVNSFNFNYMKSPGVILDEYYLPVDIYLIKDIIGEKENEIRKMVSDIIMNKHNNNTINYYLKNELRIRNGENSISDLRPNSDLFLEYIKDKKSTKKYWENNTEKVIDYYFGQIMELFQKEKTKQIEIQKEIKDSFNNENNNNNDNNEEKKRQMLKYKTELKFSVNSEDKENEKEKKISLSEMKKKEKNNPDTKNKINKFEIVKLYLGPLIFIHDLIDNIITKVVTMKEEKNKTFNSNFLVSSSIKMEISKTKSHEINKSSETFKEYNLDKNTDISSKFHVFSSERNIYDQTKLNINKANSIELISTPKKVKNSFSYINKVQSENLEINSNIKSGIIKRSESVQMRKKTSENKYKNNQKTKKTKSMIKVNRERSKTINERRRIGNKNNVIKSIDLNKNGFIHLNEKKSLFNSKNKSFSIIKHLQINVKENDLIITNKSVFNRKANLKSEKEIGLLKNHSQNYIYKKRNTNKESKSFKNKAGNNYSNYNQYNNNSKYHQRNRIPISKSINRSVDVKSHNSSKKEIANLKKNKNYLIYKKEKNDLNNFLKSPKTLEKKSSDISTTNISSICSPEQNTNKIQSIFFNKQYYYTKNQENADSSSIKKSFLNPKKNNNKVILINNIKQDLNDFNHSQNRLYGVYSKNKKIMDKKNNSQLITLLSSPNEYKNGNSNKNKKIIISNNITTYKYSRSPNKVQENSKNNNNKKLSNSHTKILKTENPNRTVSHNKRSTKNISGKEDDKLIMTKFPKDKIKQIIKRYVGNNVKEENLGKFICKKKKGKDEIVFTLEIVKQNYDSIILKSNLNKGETKAYKELLSKIKENLS